jgi:hypothetical protein
VIKCPSCGHSYKSGVKVSDMEKWWFAEGVGGEAWMEDSPSKYAEKGPYYLASEADAEFERLRNYATDAEGCAVQHAKTVIRLRALLAEVYNHGENGALHRRIGEEFGVGPGEDIPPVGTFIDDPTTNKAPSRETGTRP